MDGVIGEIRMFAGNFAPRGWQICNGELLSISSNTALFSILGTIYGGDGRTTFALPDLRGRIPMQCGQGPGLENLRLGQKKDIVFEKVSNGNVIPSIGINYIICVQGIFPSRN